MRMTLLVALLVMVGACITSPTVRFEITGGDSLSDAVLVEDAEEALGGTPLGPSGTSLVGGADGSNYLVFFSDACRTDVVLSTVDGSGTASVNVTFRTEEPLLPGCGRPDGPVVIELIPAEDWTQSDFVLGDVRETR